MSALRFLNLIGLLVVVYMAWRRWRTSRKSPPLPYPPGPNPLPVLGNLFDIPKNKQWLVYHGWAHEYGDVVSVEVLGNRFVILDTLEAARDLLERRSAIYSDRPVSNIVKLANCGWILSLARYGDRWRMERRILHQQLHSVAVRNYADVQIQRARLFARRLLKNPANYEDELRTSFGGTIIKMFYGIDIREKDDTYIAVARGVMEFLQDAAIPGKYLVEFFGWMQYIPSWFPGASFQRDAAKCRDLEYRMRHDPFNHAKATHAAGEQINSVAHRMLQDLDPEDELMEDVVRNATGMAYIASIDTSTSVITFFMLALLVYPDVQTNAQAELDRVVGIDRLPTFDDRPSLPYIEAVISESLRWIPAFHINLVHSNLSDDEYKGYFIPKGSTILVNTWAILQDPDAYPEPTSFRPERFLKKNDEGKHEYNTDVRDPRVACFGFGRRACSGRYVADQSIFATIATFLAALKISPVKDSTGNTLVPEVAIVEGTIAFPKHFTYNIEVRSKLVEDLLGYNDVASSI